MDAGAELGQVLEALTCSESNTVLWGAQARRRFDDNQDDLLDKTLFVELRYISRTDYAIVSIVSCHQSSFLSK